MPARVRRLQALQQQGGHGLGVYFNERRIAAGMRAMYSLLGDACGLRLALCEKVPEPLWSLGHFRLVHLDDSGAYCRHGTYNTWAQGT